MPITIQNSAGGGVTLDSTTTSNETLQLPSGGGTLAPLASPVFTGNVGVGVTPEAWHTDVTALQVGQSLSLFGYTTDNYLAQNTYNDAGGWKYKTTATALAYKQSTAGKHEFRVAPSGTADSAISWTTAMTIDNSGNVLVGVSSATSDGKLQTGSSNVYYGWIDRAQAGSGNPAGFFNSAGTTVGYISTGASSTSYNTSSDYRLKENVTPMSGATAQTKLLKPCNFDWIVGGNVNGFLAHELAEVVPEAVTGTKDAMMDEEYEVTPATDTEAAVMGTRSVPDMQGIDQSKLVPLLTATIQELIARIEALEGAAP